MLGPAETICARRSRASRGSTGSLPGGVAGGGSSQLGSRSPDIEARRRAAASWRARRCPSAASTSAPHGQSPRAMVSAVSFKSGEASAAMSSSSASSAAAIFGSAASSSPQATSSASAEPAHRRQAEGRRPHEGVKLQQVARRQRIESQPRRRRRPMHDQREGLGRTHGRLRPRELLDLAVSRQPQRTTRGGEESGPGRRHACSSCSSPPERFRRRRNA